MFQLLVNGQAIGKPDIGGPNLLSLLIDCPEWQQGYFYVECIANRQDLIFVDSLRDLTKNRLLALGFHEQTINDFEICWIELLQNCIFHGCQENIVSIFRIRLEIIPSVLRLSVYNPQGIEFDPIRQVELQYFKLKNDELQISGRGLISIFEYADRVDRTENNQGVRAEFYFDRVILHHFIVEDILIIEGIEGFRNPSFVRRLRQIILSCDFDCLIIDLSRYKRVITSILSIAITAIKLDEGIPNLKRSQVAFERKTYAKRLILVQGSLSIFDPNIFLFSQITVTQSLEDAFIKLDKPYILPILEKNQYKNLFLTPKICTNCQHSVSEKAHFCGSCGFSLNSTKFCRACGGTLSHSNFYCNRCGSEVKLQSKDSELKIKLNGILSSLFNQDDLEGIFFELNIDFDNISGYNKQQKVRNLILYCERNGKLDKLKSLVQHKRRNAILT